MSLGHALRRIVEEYPLARLDPPAGHPLAAVIRRSAPDELRAALESVEGSFLVKGSPGRGSLLGGGRGKGGERKQTGNGPGSHEVHHTCV